MEISLGNSRLRLKHGKPDEIINSFSLGIYFHNFLNVVFSRLHSNMELLQTKNMSLMVNHGIELGYDVSFCNVFVTWVQKYVPSLL